MMEELQMEMLEEIAPSDEKKENDPTIHEPMEEVSEMTSNSEENALPLEGEMQELISPTEAATLSPTDTEPSADDLRAELDRLREELAETRRIHERMAAEIGEFQALFPEANVSCLPESIWEQVRHGIPLAASYALYEKKCMMQKERAAAVNLRNAQKTPGAAGVGTPSEYFSPDDVRAMSQSEVRSNYQKILDSMKTWNS